VPTVRLAAAARGADGVPSGPGLGGLTEEWASAVSSALDPSEISVSWRDNQLAFSLNPAAVVRATLATARGSPVAVAAEVKPRRVLIEFSSPNIAKPFHAGHLRSTILGSYLARLHEARGHAVHRVNYLGDWGKQFGLLGVGLERFGDRAQLASDPIRHLFDVYVGSSKPCLHRRDACVCVCVCGTLAYRSV